MEVRRTAVMNGPYKIACKVSDEEWHSVHGLRSLPAHNHAQAGQSPGVPPPISAPTGNSLRYTIIPCLHCRSSVQGQIDFAYADHTGLHQGVQ